MFIVTVPRDTDARVVVERREATTRMLKLWEYWRRLVMARRREFLRIKRASEVHVIGGCEGVDIGSVLEGGGGG